MDRHVKGQLDAIAKISVSTLSNLILHSISDIMAELPNFGSGMKLSGTYIFTSANVDIYSKLIKLVGKAVEEYNKVRSDIDTKDKMKKATTKRGTNSFLQKKKRKRNLLILCRLINFPPIISADLFPLVIHAIQKN